MQYNSDNHDELSPQPVERDASDEAEYVAEEQHIPASEVDAQMQYDETTPTHELVRQVRSLMRIDEVHGFAAFQSRMEAIPRLLQIKLNDGANFIAAAHEATGLGKTTNYDIVAWLPENVSDIWSRVNAEAGAAASRRQFYKYPEYGTLVKWYKPPKPPTDKDRGDAEAGADEDDSEDEGGAKPNRTRKELERENFSLDEQNKKLVAQKTQTEQSLAELREQHDRLRQTHREYHAHLDEVREQLVLKSREARDLNERVKQLEAEKREPRTKKWGGRPMDAIKPGTLSAADYKRMLDKPLSGDDRIAAFFEDIDQMRAQGAVLDDAGERVLAWIKAQSAGTRPAIRLAREHSIRAILQRVGVMIRNEAKRKRNDDGEGGEK